MFRVISIFLTLTFTAAVIACPNLSGKYGRCGSKKHASFKIKQEKVDGTTTYHSELTDGTFSGYTITMIADGVKRDAGVEGVSISYRCEKDAG